MGRPLFSICIPCFNHVRYIERTIRSVLDQDFDDFEVIVCDNASSDGSADVVRAISDPRVRLSINRYNIGFAPNLQRVTEQASGQFINLLSSDDVMNPGALSTYARLIRASDKSTDYLLLMSDAWEIDGDGRTTRYITRSGDDLAPTFLNSLPDDVEDHRAEFSTFRGRDIFAQCMRRFTTAGIFCSVVYSRALWEQVEGYNSTRQISPDKHFIFKVLRQDPTVLYVNRPLYCYRRHAEGQGAQQRREKVLKFQVDQYSYLIEFDEQWLSGTGTTRDKQRALFIRRDCLDHALVALSEGNWTYASRLLAFAWSVDVKTTLSERNTWVLLPLLGLGPIGTPVAQLLKFLYSQRRAGGRAAHRNNQA